MKTLYRYIILVPAMVLLFSLNLSAQETIVTVKVEKDGKLVEETTYEFDDADQAHHALMMMEIMSSDDEHLKMAHKDDMEEHHGEHLKVMKYIVSDGAEEVHVMSGDETDIDVETIIEEHAEGEDVKVIVVKKMVGKCEGHEDHEDLECHEGHDHDKEVKVEKKVIKKSKKQ